MHRLTRVDEDAQRTTIRLEGRLAEASVSSLRSACAECAAAGRALTIDLTGVVFLDERAGEELRALRGRGAQLVGASAYLRAVLGCV